MAKLEVGYRTVVEPVDEYDLSSFSSPSPSISGGIRSLSISQFSDSQTQIYLGTKSGTLILLSLGHNIKHPRLTFSKSIPVVPHSAIDSIHAFPDMGGSELCRILLLSDGFLFLVDSLLSQPLRKLTFPRGGGGVGGGGGVSCAAPRTVSASSEIGSSSFSDPSTDLSKLSLLHKLGGGIKAVTSNGAKSSELATISSNCLVAIAVATAKKLVLTDIGAGSCVVLKEIQGVEEVKTMLWIDDSIFVGTGNGYTLFSCVTGQSSLMFSLPDPSQSPYLKTLSKNYEAVLLVDNVGIVVNSLGQPIGGSLLFRRRPHAVGEISSHFVGAVRDGRMDLYHKKRGGCVQSVTFAPQGVGSCFMANSESRNGQDIVVVASCFKVICFRVISGEEQIKDLLRKKSFKEAIDLVEELECEGEMTKEMLSFVHAQVGFLLLFDLRFEEAVNHFLLSESMEPSEIFPFIMRDPNRWSLLVPRTRYWGLHPPPVPLEDVVDDGLVAIQRAIFLRKAGVETASDNGFILNPPSKADLLESAISNIVRYLQISREKDLSVSMREGVDTLLMYLYRALNRVDDMEQLASSENNCLVEELETLLEESGHLRALAFLYASKRMSSKALAIWRTLARQYAAGMWKDCSVKNDSSKVTCSQMTAATEASKLLQGSSDEDMVLQHLGWVADVDQELAVRILTSDERTIQLSPEEVISAIDTKKVEILQRYLQWLIEDQDSVDTRFHTLYALSLAKSALEIVEKEIPDARLSEETCVSDTEGCTISRSSIREQLQFFLHYSNLYDQEEVLDLIEESELWLEKSILYRKLGQETLVLQILALKLEDSEAAEEYCAEIGRQDAYMQLLDIYLDPQDGKQPMFKAAVRLLHNHGESLDPRHVLETLSEDMPLQLASDTILRMLRARVHHHCQGQIVHSISRALNVDAKLARLEERSRSAQINDESLCDSCHARLGTKLFAMYPDDSIVCYKCYRRLGDSISVAGRDFKKDVIIKPGWLVNH